MEVNISINQNTALGVNKQQGKSGEKDSFSNVLASLSESITNEEEMKEEFEVDESIIGLMTVSPQFIFHLADEAEQPIVNKEIKQQDQPQSNEDISNHVIKQTGLRFVSISNQNSVVNSVQMELKQMDGVSSDVFNLAQESEQILKSGIEIPAEILSEIDIVVEPPFETSSDLNSQYGVSNLQTVRTVIPQYSLNRDTNFSENKVSDFAISSLMESGETLDNDIDFLSLNPKVNEPSIEGVEELEIGTETIISNSTPTVYKEGVTESTKNISTTITWENKFEIMDELYQTAQTLNQNEAKTIVLKLYPRNLGNIEVVLSLKDGILAAKMTVDQSDVKEIMEKSLQQLASQFERNQVKIQSVEVTVQTDAQEFNKQSDGRSNQSKKERQTKELERAEQETNQSSRSLKELIASLI